MVEYPHEKNGKVLKKSNLPHLPEIGVLEQKLSTAILKVE